MDPLLKLLRENASLTPTQLNALVAEATEQVQRGTLSLPGVGLQLLAGLGGWRIALKGGGTELEYTFDANDDRAGIASLLQRLGELGIGYKDLNTTETSLEDIFVSLVSERA